MKFTDGYWMIREGVHPQHPAEAYDIETDAQRLTVYAPTKRVNTRGDTLNGTLLTIQFSTPMTDVIRVKLSHHSGGLQNRPAFELFEGPVKPSIEVNDTVARFTSGRLTAQVARGERWQIDFLGDGKPLTKSQNRAMGSVAVDGQGHFMHEQLSLGVGETVYGLGERFTAFVKNGQEVEIWNKDGGTGSEQAYKNIPFYLTNRGYGVFVNDSGPVSFEVASEKVSRVQFSVPGHELDYFVIYGPTPKQILEKYTALTGRPALPPAWSFGLWLTTSFTTKYDEATVTSFIQGMADREIPLHVFHFDCFWMREYNWCDFAWDPRAFPEPEAMLERIKARGLKVCLWINSYIAQRSPLFAEAAQAGYLLKRPDGSVWQWDLWQAGMGLVDFTNPDACEWYKSRLRPLLAMGVDCFKTDFGERIPTDVVYFDGSDPLRMHNYYAYLYNQVVYELLEEVRGRGEAMLFARSATVGGQQYPVHWGGDCDSTFPSMAESLRGGLSLCLSGFGFWSHDIGGFEGLPDPELYKRWIAFGLLSSHSRLHGSSSYRVPWLIDEESVDVLRHFTRLKCSLMPYLYAAAVEAQETGVPLMRAMLLEFPADPSCDYLDRQYMLGDSLLVAPVFDASGHVSYYLPEGQWTNFLSGEVVVGPRWVRERHDPMSIPLLVRPNSLIPVGANSERPDYNYSDGVTLRAYQISNGARIALQIPDQEGAWESEFSLSREGNEIFMTALAPNDSWRLLLVGVKQLAYVEGATFEQSDQGVVIAPIAGNHQIVIHLS